MIFIRTFKIDKLFFRLEIKYKFMKLLIGCDLLQNLFTIVFEATITNKSLLNGNVLFSDKFSDRK